MVDARNQVSGTFILKSQFFIKVLSVSCQSNFSHKQTELVDVAAQSIHDVKKTYAIQWQ